MAVSRLLCDRCRSGRSADPAPGDAWISSGAGTPSRARRTLALAHEEGEQAGHGRREDVATGGVDRGGELRGSVHAAPSLTREEALDLDDDGVWVVDPRKVACPGKSNEANVRIRRDESLRFPW